MHKVHLKTVKIEIEYVFFFEWKLINFFFVLWLLLLLGAVVSHFKLEISISWRKKKCVDCWYTHKCISKTRKKCRPTTILYKRIFFRWIFCLIFTWSMFVVYSFIPFWLRPKFCAKRNSQLDIFGLRSFFFLFFRLWHPNGIGYFVTSNSQIIK